MRSIVLVPALICLVTGVSPRGFARLQEVNPGLNDFSIGYRLGTLTKISHRGRGVSTGEATMLLGNDSGFVLIPKKFDPKADGHPLTNFAEGMKIDDFEKISPWQFSVAAKDENFLDSMMGSDPVVVQYAQKRIKNLLNDTDYVFFNAFRTKGMPFKPSSFQVEQKNIYDYSNGVRFGRFAKVSYKGKALKSWEVQIQEGLAGDKFHLMTIQSTALAKYAILTMVSGLPAKIYYRQAGMLEARVDSDTDYDVVRIELDPAAVLKAEANRMPLPEVPPGILNDNAEFNSLNHYIYDAFLARPN